MQFKLSGNNLYVIRETSDPLKYYGESNVLYHVKQQLEVLGFDLIKKRMWKDRHLVADEQQYLRARNHRTQAPHIYLHNDHYAISRLGDDWNAATEYMQASDTWKGNHLILAVTFDVFEKQPDCRDRVQWLLDKPTALLVKNTGKHPYSVWRIYDPEGRELYWDTAFCFISSALEQEYAGIPAYLDGKKLQ